MEKDIIDRFNDFEVEIQFLIEDIQQAFSKSKKYHKETVDYKLNTVDTVEQFYIDLLHEKETLPYSMNHFERALIAYLGETLIFHAGGHWRPDSNKNLVTYGTPTIYGFKHDEDKLGFSPVGIIGKQSREMKKGIFRSSLEFCINKKDILDNMMKEMENLARKKKK